MQPEKLLEAHSHEVDARLSQASCNAMLQDDFTDGLFYQRS